MPFWLASIGIIALVTRLDGFVSGSFDGQELFNRRAVEGSLAHMFAAVHHDLLYYAVLKATTVFAGLGPTGLRLPSLLFGMATVFLTFFASKRLLGRPYTGLFAAGLVALSFQQLTKSQTARSYSMYAVLVLAMMLLLWRAVQRPGNVKAWLAFTASAVMLTFSHITGWLYVGATLPAIIACSNRRVLRSWAVSILATVATFAGWGAILLPRYLSRLETAAHLRIPNLDSGRQLVQSYASLNGLPDFRHATLATLVISVSLLAVVAARVLRQPGAPSDAVAERTAIALIAGVALLPPALLVLLTALPLGITWEFHYVFPSQAAFVLLTALGVALLFRSPLAAVRPFATVAAPLLLLAQVVPIIQKAPSARRVPFSHMAHYLVEQRVEPSPNVYAASWYWIGAPLNFYLRVDGSPRDSVAELPMTPPTGSDLWLFYRLGSVRDSAAVSQLIRHGWATKGAVTFSRSGIDKMGVRLIHLRVLRAGHPTGVPADPAPGASRLSGG